MNAVASVRRFVTVVVIVVLVTALVLLSRATAPAEEGPDLSTPLAVHATTVRWQSGYHQTRVRIGAVKARQSSDLAFDVSGRLASCTVDEGDVVAANALIATLDDSRLRARRDERAASVVAATASLALAERTRTRLEEAHVTQSVSTQALDDATTHWMRATAQRDQLQSALDAAEVDVRETRLRSPFDGVVARRHVDAGTVVAAGTTVLTLLEMHAPEVWLSVPPSDALQLRVGDEADVIVHGTQYTGTVQRTLPTLDRGTRSVRFILTLSASLKEVREGAVARIETAHVVETPGFWLPLSALTEGDRGLWVAYRITEDSVQRADVEVLHVDAPRVYARGDLIDGDRIVTAGLHRLTPGMSVEVAEAPSS